MIRKFFQMILAVSTAVALAWSAAPGAAAAQESSTTKVMGSIDVPSGEHTGDVSTVNGSVRVGSDAIVGSASAVNGSVRLESHATASQLGTVNGAIEVQDGAHVTGPIRTVNGSLRVGDAADVSGNVSNVNGSIHIAGAHVGGSIGTSNGNIDLGPNAKIDGDVVMHKDNNNGWFNFGDSHLPRVLVEPGTVVRGTMRFEREVKLYVSDHATIGTVEGATVQRYSGDRPPSE
jgi:cytoskeletal protein CcmA (bactofilin family)